MKRDDSLKRLRALLNGSGVVGLSLVLQSCFGTPYPTALEVHPVSLTHAPEKKSSKIDRQTVSAPSRVSNASPSHSAYSTPEIQTDDLETRLNDHEQYLEQLEERERERERNRENRRRERERERELDNERRQNRRKEAFLKQNKSDLQNALKKKFGK